MNVTELKAQLRAHPESSVRILLPDGSTIPAHYHLTEVGHVAKKFVDCGGTFRASETCMLQVYFDSARDDGHRLTAGRFARILDLAQPILPTEELPVEMEYEAGVISQFPLTRFSVGDGVVHLHLCHKHTDCLAKEKCGSDEGCGCASEPVEEVACCAGPAGKAGCC